MTHAESIAEGCGESLLEPSFLGWDAVGMPTIRELDEADRGWKLTTLTAGWGSTWVARLGELIDAAPLPGFVAEHGGERAGLATYAERADGVEVVTIQSLVEGEGVGRALMDRLLTFATESRAARLWLMTTNDNVRAFAFYQRWGMDLARLIEGGVEVSRRVKPSIPAMGQNGIARRHELEFELKLP
jgi:GNAT superfamily N-acetyltransferase